MILFSHRVFETPKATWVMLPLCRHVGPRAMFDFVPARSVGDPQT